MLEEHQNTEMDSMDGMLEDDTLLRGDMEAQPVMKEVDRQTGDAPSAGLCGCFTVGYYRTYFDVDTKDVLDRLLATVTFYKSEPTFLSLVTRSPDAYGPFWVATTLIFIISVTSNLARTLSHGYSYDFELVTFCVSLIYGYLACLTIFLWAACKYFLAIPVGLINLLCLIGYSMILYVPAAVISTISILAWPALIFACTCNILFLLRSLLPVFSQQKQKSMTVLGLLAGCQLLFMLILKLKFYSHGGF